MSPRGLQWARDPPCPCLAGEKLTSPLIYYQAEPEGFLSAFKISIREKCCPMLRGSGAFYLSMDHSMLSVKDDLPWSGHQQDLRQHGSWESCKGKPEDGWFLDCRDLIKCLVPAPRYNNTNNNNNKGSCGAAAISWTRQKDLGSNPSSSTPQGRHHS